MVELKGLEKLTFTYGKVPATEQFSKKLVKIARDRFRNEEYKGIDSNIFQIGGENLHCFGVRNKFEVSNNNKRLTISGKEYNGVESQEDSINEIFDDVLESVIKAYNIPQVIYK